MKKIIAVLVLLGFAQHAFSQQIDYKLLAQYYQQAHSHKNKDSVIYQKKFFSLFPSNFDELKKLYGYDDKTDKDYPLHAVAFDHINYFFSLKCIDSNVFVKKAISISVNAIPQVDGINSIRSGLQDLVHQHPKLFLTNLIQLAPKDALSVWRFYFDYENSFFRKADYEKVLKLAAIYG